MSSSTSLGHTRHVNTRLDCHNLPAQSLLLVPLSAMPLHTNLFSRLQQRSSFQSPHPAHTSAHFHPEHYNNFTLRARIDTTTSRDQPSAPFRYFDAACPVVELACTHHVLFVLNKRGGCAAYHLPTQRLLRHVNVSEDDVMRSVFYNRHRNELITVSVHWHDTNSSLHCRSTPLAALIASPPLSLAHFALRSSPLLPNESLVYPGFVEFDDLNGIMLSYSRDQALYKLWRLSDYTVCWQRQGGPQHIREVKTCPGMVLLVEARLGRLQRLSVVECESGVEVGRISHMMTSDDDTDCEYIELFNHYVVIKERHQPLVILDLLQPAAQTRIAPFPCPDAFIFLYERRLFLTFNGREVRRWHADKADEWSRDGGVGFEGQLLAYGGSTSIVYVSAKQEVMVAYCKDDRSPGGESDGDAQCICISDIESGRLIGRASAWKRRLVLEECSEGDEAKERAEDETKMDETIITHVAASGHKRLRRGARRTDASSRRVRRRSDQPLTASHTDTETEEDSSSSDEIEVQADNGESTTAVAAAVAAAVSVRSMPEPSALTVGVGDKYAEELWDEERGKALRAITAIYYNEETNEIITGNAEGVVHIWSCV